MPSSLRDSHLLAWLLKEEMEMRWNINWWIVTSLNREAGKDSQLHCWWMGAAENIAFLYLVTYWKYSGVWSNHVFTQQHTNTDMM